MTVNIIRQKANPLAHSIELAVEQSGLDITVKSGSFRYESVDYALGQDFTFTATQRPEKTDVIAFFAIRDSDGVVVVVVDENVYDETGWSESFEWDGSGYTRVCAIWNTNIPANTATLDDVNINIYHFAFTKNQKPFIIDFILIHFYFLL